MMKNPRATLCAWVFQDDYEVYTAANLSQASALLQEESPDLVLTDLRLGGESGMDVLKAAASLPHPPQSIMMTPTAPWMPP